MGIERWYRPEHFRKRARQFREKAQGAEHALTRASLLKAAAEFDKLARRSEQIRTIEDLERG